MLVFMSRDKLQVSRTGRDLSLASPFLCARAPTTSKFTVPESTSAYFRLRLRRIWKVTHPCGRRCAERHAAVTRHMHRRHLSPNHRDSKLCAHWLELTYEHATHIPAWQGCVIPSFFEAPLAVLRGMGGADLQLQMSGKALGCAKWYRLQRG